MFFLKIKISFRTATKLFLNFVPQQVNRRLLKDKIKMLPYNLAYRKRLVNVKIDRSNFDPQIQ